MEGMHKLYAPSPQSCLFGPNRLNEVYVAPYGWTKCSKLSQHMHIDMLHVSDIRPGKKVVDDVRKHGEAIRVHQLQVLR